MSNKLTEQPETTTQPTHFIGMVGGDLARLTWAGFTALPASIPDASIVATTKLTATGTKDATTFLRGDNTYAVPGGSNSLRLAGATASTLAALTAATAATGGLLYGTQAGEDRKFTITAAGAAMAEAANVAAQVTLLNAATLGANTFTGSQSLASGNTLNWNGDLLLSRLAAATLQLGVLHASVGTAQYILSHSVTTGTGASIWVGAGTGSVAGGSVILATRATTGALVSALMVDPSGMIHLNGSTGSGNGAFFRRSDVDMLMIHKTTTGEGIIGIGSAGYSHGVNIRANAHLAWTQDTPASSRDITLMRVAAGVLGLTASASTVGATLEMREQTAPSAPGADNVRIYAVDNGGGKTQLMALFATGAAQQIAIQP